MTAPAPFPPRCARAYAAVRRLAATGHAHVWLATQRDLDRPAVVKLLGPEALASPAEVQRFRDEAVVTASLAHEHIVRLYDQDIEGGVPWIALEYLEGPPLAEVLARGPMPLGEALEAARQIALAVDEAHRRGVLHRDVKPENVLRAQPGHWKVADFGIAKWGGSSAVTPHGMVVGTPAYVAPEQIQGAPASPLSDIYALGVLLYQAVTGRLPFLAGTPIETLELHVTGTAPRPSEIVGGLPAGVDGLVLAAMAREPAQRPQSAERLAEMLELLMQRIGAKVTGPLRISGALKVRRPPAASPPPARGAAAVAVALVAAGLIGSAVAVGSRVAPATGPVAPHSALTVSAAETFPSGPPSAAPAAPNDPTATRLVAGLRAELAQLESGDEGGYKRTAAAQRVFRALRQRAGSLAPRYLDAQLRTLAVDGVRRAAVALSERSKDLLVTPGKLEATAREYRELVHDFTAIAPALMQPCPGDPLDEWFLIAGAQALCLQRFRLVSKEAQVHLERAIAGWYDRAGPQCWPAAYLRGLAERGLNPRRGLVYLEQALARLEARIAVPSASHNQWDCWVTVMGMTVATVSEIGDAALAEQVLERAKRGSAAGAADARPNVRESRRTVIEWATGAVRRLAGPRRGAPGPGAAPGPSAPPSSR